MEGRAAAIPALTRRLAAAAAAAAAAAGDTEPGRPRSPGRPGPSGWPSGWPGGLARAYGPCAYGPCAFGPCAFGPCAFGPCAFLGLPEPGRAQAYPALPVGSNRAFGPRCWPLRF